MLSILYKYINAYCIKWKIFKTPLIEIKSNINKKIMLQEYQQYLKQILKIFKNLEEKHLKNKILSLKYLSKCFKFNKIIFKFL